jgi:hypothetical protein
MMKRSRRKNSTRPPLTVDAKIENAMAICKQLFTRITNKDDAETPANTVAVTSAVIFVDTLLTGLNTELKLDKREYTALKSSRNAIYRATSLEYPLARVLGHMALALLRWANEQWHQNGCSNEDRKTNIYALYMRLSNYIHLANKYAPENVKWKSSQEITHTLTVITAPRQATVASTSQPVQNQAPAVNNPTTGLAISLMPLSDPNEINYVSITFRASTNEPPNNNSGATTNNMFCPSFTGLITDDLPPPDIFDTGFDDEQTDDFAMKMW